MITCIVTAVASMYVYFTSKHWAYLVMSVLFFVLASACHHKLRSRVDDLEKKLKAVIEAQNETNKFMVAQIRINNGVASTMRAISGVKEDDLK